MAFPEQIDKLVTRMAELTGQGKVEWQETGNLNTYLTPVGKYIVTLGIAGHEVYGGFTFQILDQTGKVIDGVLANFAPNTMQNQDWERLRNLHEQARRRALRSEQAVSDLLSSLDKIA